MRGAATSDEHEAAGCSDGRGPSTSASRAQNELLDIQGQFFEGAKNRRVGKGECITIPDGNGQVKGAAMKEGSVSAVDVCIDLL